MEKVCFQRALFFFSFLLLMSIAFFARVVDSLLVTFDLVEVFLMKKFRKFLEHFLVSSLLLNH